MRSVTIYWEFGGQGTLDIEGRPDPLEAGQQCVNAAISILMDSGDTMESAKKRIILSLVNSLEETE